MPSAFWLFWATLKGISISLFYMSYDVNILPKELVITSPAMGKTYLTGYCYMCDIKTKDVILRGK